MKPYQRHVLAYESAVSSKMGIFSPINMTICAGLMIFIQIFTLPAFASEPGYFSDACLGSNSVEDKKSFIEQELKLAETEISALMKIPDVQTVSPNYKIFEKRLYILHQLISYIHEQKKHADHESILFSWQGMKELRLLLDFTRDELQRDGQKEFFEQHNQISVTDFGAVGNGRNDDAPAFRKAIAFAAAQKGKAVKIKVPAGRYLLNSLHPVSSPSLQVIDTAEETTGKAVDPVSSPSLQVIDTLNRLRPLTDAVKMWEHGHLVLINLSNVLIEGEAGTQLIFGDSTSTAIRLVGCENVKLKNLSLDYRTLPFTQGNIVEVDKSTDSVIFRTDDGYPSPASELFIKAPSRRATVHDAETGAFIWDAGDRFLGAVKAEQNNTYRIQIKRSSAGSPVDGLCAGQKFVIIARYDASGSAIVNNNSSFCTFENIHIYSSPGVAFMNWRNQGLRFVNCKVAPPEGTTRLISSNGDGIQYVNGLVGPYISGCTFSRLQDDAVMVSTRSVSILNKDKPDCLVVNSSGRMFFPGASVALLDSQTGNIKALSSCTSLTLKAGKTFIRIALPLPEITSAKMLLQSKLSFSERLDYYNGAKKFPRMPDSILCLSLSNSGTVVTNNSISDLRGTGIKIQCANALIESTRIMNLKGTAILISSLMQWNEPFCPHNIIVTGNCISNVSTGIKSFYMLYNRILAGSCPIRGLVIENNSGSKLSQRAAELQNCADVILRNNDFKLQQGHSGVFFINMAKNMSIVGNAVTLPNNSKSSVIIWGNRADSVNIKANNNQINYEK